MPSVARSRYNRTALLLSIAYVVLLFGVTFFFKNAPRAGVGAYAAAVLPALPIIGIFLAIGRYIVEEKDEYLRMKMVRQALIATGFTLTLATIWGFLENYGLAPRVDSYWAAILWFGGLGLGACVNRFTFGDGGC